MTDRKQELRRQLRVVRRSPHLIAALFLLRTGLLQTGLLQTGDDLDFAAALQLHREQARLQRKLARSPSRTDAGLGQVTHTSSCVRPKEAIQTERAGRRVYLDRNSRS